MKLWWRDGEVGAVDSDPPNKRMGAAARLEQPGLSDDSERSGRAGEASLDLPNGMRCILASDGMIGAAKYLRRGIFSEQCYRHPGFELRPTDAVLDIGAHVGLFMLWAAPQVVLGRIVCVEPNEKALACLERSIAANGLTNVVAMHAAVGRKGGTAEIVFRPGLEALGYNADAKPPWFYRNDTLVARLWLWLLARAANPRSPVQPMQRVSAPCLTLDEIIDAQRLDVVDFLKIDCEGCEFEILRTTRSSTWKRIERVVLEYHESPRDGRVRSELVSILESNGFDVEVESSSRWHLYGSRFGLLWGRNRGGRQTRASKAG